MFEKYRIGRLAPLELSSTLCAAEQEWTVQCSEMYRLSMRSDAKKLCDGLYKLPTAVLPVVVNPRRRAILMENIWGGLLGERLSDVCGWHIK